MVNTIGNPLSWMARFFGWGVRRVEDGTSEMVGQDPGDIQIRKLQLADLRTALRRGFDDFQALRTDVIFIVLIYPIIGFVLVWVALNAQMLPLLFPLISGFALLGPVAAIGLYEMSRQRELGEDAGLSDAIRVMVSSAQVPILVLGLYLVAVFVMWLIAANMIFQLTLGPEPPVSIMAFAQQIFTTAEGWTMLIVGVAVGFVFAAVVLATSIVSFPLLVDRHVGIVNAVVTSLRVARKSPIAVAAWGLIVTVLLGLGVLTLFVGLIVVLPVLGHATWHLYRRAVVAPPTRVVL